MNTRTAERRVPPSQALLSCPVVAVLRAGAAADYAPVVETLGEAGIRSIELTLSTPGTLEGFNKLRSTIPDEIEIGVGTVTSMVQALAAIEAGADFLVTPVTDTAIVEACAAAGVPVYPGGLTPTELHAGWAAGATAVKLFPASTVGPGYIGQLKGPFPGIQVVPSGGIGIEDIGSWMAAGALAVSLGGPLIGDAFKGGSLTALKERATSAVEAALEGRVQS
ncbi:bifunctional 4-hydroxy-2-oxoglutarate aldolase/2-dehydro-3-deoxy-phosphogluconate aldolase [Pseudarthrobacter oxydans]|uniref:bifunctional 4-hydroxy-2-oxoglutarate aldolase/2-dehydro-3-deoxy-phosphogluconate aldolase n=1 Tax=Pseudarthrobacter oxydans TaxID=1671 RepID=UPI003821B978